MLSSFNYYTDGFDGPSNAWTLAGGLIRPASRGEIRLLSNDLAAPPLIDPNYLSESTDLRLWNKRIARGRRICNAHSPVWQYRGTDHHDWRESRRYDRC
jgi:choline dehydrogenase-like flavoprotein